MKITSATLYALKIPFVAAFRHHLCQRHYSDSLVIKLTTDSGISGYGEGVARPYVTSETPATCSARIRQHVQTHCLGADLGTIDPRDPWEALDALCTISPSTPQSNWHAARCAVEVALLDLVLRCHEQSLQTLLPPQRSTVTYSAIIGDGSPADVTRRTEQCRALGFGYVKLKIGETAPTRQIARVRNILGSSVSLRVDANMALTRERVEALYPTLVRCRVEALEQPLPRKDLAEMAALRATCPISLMADESIVTEHDLDTLIKAHAIDALNLRLSKCGGLRPTINLARCARQAGLDIQLGCQVGETAVLSAAGRHMAAYLGCTYVEGSYGRYLLTEDLAQEDIRFGPGGQAPLLNGPGLGITVLDKQLKKYARQIITLH